MKCISEIFYEKPKPWCPISPAFSEMAWSPGELMLLSTSFQGGCPPGCCCCDKEALSLQSRAKASNWPSQWWTVKVSQEILPLVTGSSMSSLSHTLFNPNSKRSGLCAGVMIRPPETGTGREEGCWWFQNKEPQFPSVSLSIPATISPLQETWRYTVRMSKTTKTGILSYFVSSPESPIILLIFFRSFS